MFLGQERIQRGHDLNLLACPCNYNQQLQAQLYYSDLNVQKEEILGRKEVMAM